MSERSASPAAPPRRTLMAPPAALARVQKVLPVELAVPPRPAVQHAADKSAKKPPIVRRPQVGEDPAALAERRARLARRNALFLKLRAISPALFAAIPAPPMAIGIYDVLVGRLGLDPEGKADLRRIISEHVNRPGYQRVLTAEGAVRLDVNGEIAGAVTEEQRQIAMTKLERLKAKRKG